MILWMLASMAWGAAPDHLATTIDVGSGKLSKLQLSSDEQLLVGLDATGVAFLLDLGSWESFSLSEDVCDAASVAAIPTTDGADLFVGCSDATVSLWTYDGRSVSQVTTDSDTASGTASYLDLSSDTIGTDAVVEALLPVLDGSGLIAVTASSSSANYASVIDPDTGVLLAGSSAVPTALYDGTVNDVARAADNVLAVHRGSGEISQITASGTTISVLELASTLGTGVIGLRPDGSDLGVGPTGLYYVGDDSTDALLSLSGTGNWSVALYVTNPISSAFHTNGWALVGRSSGVEVYDGFGSSSSSKPDTTIATGRPDDLLTDSYEYGFVGTSDGEIAVLTDRPFVSDASISPSIGVDGTTATVSFLTDSEGSFSVRVGGSRAGTDGTEVYSGTVDEAGVVNEISFDIDDSFDEGDNDVYIVVTDASGRRGVRKTSFELANPPDAITLSSANVGFGDGRILLDFAGLATSDVASFEVYFTDTVFSALDYSTSGPTFTETVGDDEVSSPVSVDNETDTTGSVSYGIEPLVNGKTYYVAVRTVDSTGLESEMSNIVEVIPRETFLAAELAGEAGGPPEACACNGSGSGSWPLWGLGLVAAGLLRRRRGAAVVAAALLALPVAAQAQSSSSVKRFKADLTPAWGNAEFTYSRFQYDDEQLDTVYGGSGNMFRVEVGPQLWRVAEIDLGIGYHWKKGYAADSSDVESADAGRLIMVPLNLDLTLRAHILDEQPIVPYVRVGGDYVFWKETALDADGEANVLEQTTGSKAGWHWEAGGQILLDVLAPRRASVLEANSGINDTWLTVGYRRQTVGANSTGLSFGGWELRAGIKIDY